MLKRCALAALILMVLVASSLAMLIWPPAALRSLLLSRLSQKVSASTSYELVVAHLSGNLLDGLSFQNVRLLSKSDHAEITHAQSVAVKIDWKKLWKEKILRVEPLAIDLDTGRVVILGQYNLTPDRKGEFILDLSGRLADAPIELHAVGKEKRLDEGHLVWVKSKTFSVLVDIPKNGRGVLTVRSKTAFGNIRVAGKIDVVHRGIDVHGTADHMDRKGVQSAGVALRGRWPSFQSTGSIKFQNGAVVDATGRLFQEDQSWRFIWRQLTASFPAGGSWVSQKEGSLRRYPDGTVDIHHLDLVNGAQSLQVTDASFHDGFIRLDAAAQNVNPTPWLNLAGSGVAMQGTLNASVHIQGRWPHPSVDGFVKGQWSSLSIDPIGLKLKDVELDAQSHRQMLSIHATGKTKKGDIQITGKSQLPDLNYELHAHELALQMSAVTKGTGDADIQLKGTLKSPQWMGKITIKEAVYALPEKNKKAAPSSPVPVLPLNEGLDVRVIWPQNVWYRDGVTSIETNGDLRIQKAPAKEALLLTGTIRSLRGSYNYFGRDFNMESGQIQFTGAPGLTPVLNIEASYRSDPTIVYLDITGTAEKPELKMHSNPPLTEQDIISVIVFGQPLNELRSRTGGSSANQEAMQAAGGVLGSYLAKGLRQTGLQELNLDVVNIQPTPQGSQLTLGRYVSRKMFVSYGQALRGSAEKSITADYFLTDKWTLQGASDSIEGNYMDFLFRYPLNKRQSSTNNPPLPTSPFRNTLDQPTILQPLGSSAQ